MASFTFDIGSYGLQHGDIVWASDTIKCRGVISSVTPVITGTSMTGLTGTGTDFTLASKTLTNDTTNNRTVYGCANGSITAVPASTIGWIVFYKFVTNDAGSTPIFCADITDFIVGSGNPDILVTIPAGGIGYTQQ